MRKDLLDRQNTLGSDLESLGALVKSNQSQKQGQSFFEARAQIQLLKTCSLGLQEDDIEHTRNLSHLLELTKDEIIEETLRFT